MRAGVVPQMPELVWRKATPPEPEEAVHPAVAAQGLTREAAVAATASQTRPPALPAPEALPLRRPTMLSDLDPNLVDRLADDVIRRVERRARIERERRGL